MWGEMLHHMSAEKGVSAEMLAQVLNRVALAREPVPRSAISKGSMLIRPKTLASGTVGKAVDTLTRRGLLAENGTTNSGRPGPPITPLRLGDEWAIVGLHIDQQHDGPDWLTGIVCGLDRMPLTETERAEVPRNGDQHDRDRLAEEIRNVTEALLKQLGRPRKFLGVGIEIGGHVHRGVVEDSVHAGWTEKVDLHNIVAKELKGIPGLAGIPGFEVPGVAENDVNALTIHGYYVGSFEKLDTTLVTVLRQGVGAGLIANGRMYRGGHSMAPEIGHLHAEHPEDTPGWGDLPASGSGERRTFGDQCLCSSKTKDRKAYGHVDCLAVPARIEGELAFRKKGETITLEKAAAAPQVVAQGETFMLSDEAIVLRRAGRALGRGLAAMINVVNPSQLVLRLPQALATPVPQSSGAEYRAAVESEIDSAYSTGPADARNGRHQLRVEGYDEDDVARDGAVAAATTVFNAFLEHARGRDGCDSADDGGRSTGAIQRGSQARTPVRS
jgi:predicted NBD/HSP70 family sugar kinase